MCSKVAVGVREPSRVGGSDDRLAISPDRRRIIGRLDQRERLAFGDMLPLRDENTGYRPGERGHDRSGLVVVEIDSAGRLDLLAVADGNDCVELDVRALSFRQPDVGNGRRGAVFIGRWRAAGDRRESERRGVGPPKQDLPAIGRARELRPMPPAAAKRLEECRGIGEPVRLGLD